MIYMLQGSFLSNLGRFPSSYIGSANDGMGLGGIIPALVNIMVLGNNWTTSASKIYRDSVTPDLKADPTMVLIENKKKS